MTIGAYMIVRNEEACLGACLASISALDEIVVLDTGSTDKTAEVAAKYPCRYLAGEYAWQDDFADARNHALAHATSDYLLVIDADETLGGGRAPLDKAVAEHPDADCFQMATNSIGGRDVHYSVRLHRNAPGRIKWHGACHNYLSVAGGPIIADAEIRYGRSPAHDLDPDRSLRILTKVCLANPLLARERYYLAREWAYRKKWDEALRHLEIYFPLSRYAPELAEAKLLAAKCEKAKGNIDATWRWLGEAARVNADFAEVFREMAALSGPKNREYWLRTAAACSNRDVLFIRNPATPQPK